MNSYILKKEHLPAYLKRLSKTFDVQVPVRAQGITLFAPYEEHLELDFASHTRLSAKSYFLPQHEVLLRYEGDGSQQQQAVPDTPKVLFGVKPCDARAVELNARLLVNDPDGGNPQDIYFKTRIENTTMLGYGCDRPGAACFCSSCGGGPFDHTGLDGLITDIGAELLITIFEDREKSRALIHADLMEESTSEALETSRRVAEEAEKKLSMQSELVKPETDSSTLFTLSIWEETAQRCVNCGICTYLCPTCTCFDMTDEVSEGCGTQSRCWDSCMFSLFTLHASGHNPRPGRKERVRQRFMHKLNYFPDRYDGVVSCVGCGRCVIHCPVNIDIREISRLMAEAGGISC